MAVLSDFSTRKKKWTQINTQGEHLSKIFSREKKNREPPYTAINLVETYHNETVR